jgi:hypothetical protein
MVKESREARVLMDQRLALFEWQKLCGIGLGSPRHERQHFLALPIKTKTSSQIFAINGAIMLLSRSIMKRTGGFVLFGI